MALKKRKTESRGPFQTTLLTGLIRDVSIIVMIYVGEECLNKFSLTNNEKNQILEAEKEYYQRISKYPSELMDKVWYIDTDIYDPKTHKSKKLYGLVLTVKYYGKIGLKSIRKAFKHGKNPLKYPYLEETQSYSTYLKDCTTLFRNGPVKVKPDGITHMLKELDTLL